MNRMHEANRRGWDAVSAGWQAAVERNVDWRRCPEDPTIALGKRELDLLGKVAGKDICVLGSGDNLAVFALAGLGARVTSVDISRVQLDKAACRADELCLDIAFLRTDVVDLRALGGESFDLVYTGDHVAVWVSDLSGYYAEASQILRRGGTFIIKEYHPFRRLWQDTPDRLELKCGYFQRGPTAMTARRPSPACRRARCPATSSTGRWRTTSRRSWRPAATSRPSTNAAIGASGGNPHRWRGSRPRCCWLAASGSRPHRRSSPDGYAPIGWGSMMRVCARTASLRLVPCTAAH